MESPLQSRTVCRPSLLPHAERSLSDDSRASNYRDGERASSSLQGPFPAILMRLRGYDSAREKLMLSFFNSSVQRTFLQETRKSEQQNLYSKMAPECRCLRGISFLRRDQYLVNSQETLPEPWGSPKLLMISSSLRLLSTAISFCFVL